MKTTSIFREGKWSSGSIDCAKNLVTVLVLNETENYERF
jgi:hypothetical protein